MRIGEAARTYNITVSRLQYYIHHGLLVPPRVNNQYVFDEKTLADLEWILELKERMFPLKTIHRLLSLRRISHLCSQEDQQSLYTIYCQQEEWLEKQAAALANAREKVHSDLIRYEHQQISCLQTGVPVETLNLLCCPCCGSDLRMEQVSMNQQYIFQASIRCTCGYTASIENGILKTGNKNLSQYDKPDTTRELYRDLPSNTLSLFEQSYRWLEQSIQMHTTPGKIWIESYVNAWFFFTTIWICCHRMIP